MSDRLKLPPYRDFAFYQRRKHDKWREVPPPEPPLEASVADSHAHIHMFTDPVWELARCAANGVDFVCAITDPSEDGSQLFDNLEEWKANTRVEVRIAAGVHPHNAKLYTGEIERELLERLKDPRVSALGEIGLDYHYDLSLRETQREVFRRQIDLAKQKGMPIALHLRGGEDPEADNAHREAFEILREKDALGPTTLLHCCALPPDELRPWVEADCFVAYGGALTFKNADAAREGALIVPENRLLVETDAPYLAPVPYRGKRNKSSFAYATAAKLGEIHGVSTEEMVKITRENALRFFRMEKM